MTAGLLKVAVSWDRLSQSVASEFCDWCSGNCAYEGQGSGFQCPQILGDIYDMAYAIVVNGAIQEISDVPSDGEILSSAIL